MMALMHRVAFFAAILALSSCASLYPFDYYVLREGPISIGAQWTAIHCPEVIETTRPEKELWLLLPQPLDVPDYRDKVAVFRESGERVEIYAEVVDTAGKVYPMSVWSQRGMLAGRPREGTYMRLLSDDLPKTFRFTSVRLRSSHPIVLSELLWISTRRPGPPGKDFYR